jgi:hypothetical protein
MHGTLPLSEAQALASLRDGTVARTSVAALAREWGWTRGTVRHRLERWRKNGDLPPIPKRGAIKRNRPAKEAPTVSAPVPAPAPEAAAIPAPPSPAGADSSSSGFARVLGTVLLASIGVAMAAIGMVETTNYALRVGGLLFAGLAVCADALVLLMPAAVAALWRRRSPAMIVAAGLWLVGGAVTLANLSGYVGSSDDAFRAVRESGSMQRTLALEQLARLRNERAGITEMRPVGALNIAIRNARRSNKPALREALAMAERRDALEAELSALAANLPAIPQLAIVDPSANVLSEISGTAVSEISLRRVRLMLLLLLPLCGGFVVSVALSLVPVRQLHPNH